MRKTLDLIIKCNSKKNSKFFGKEIKFENYLAPFLHYIVQKEEFVRKLKIEGLTKLNFRKAEKEIENKKVDGYYTDQDGHKWYIELKVSFDCEDDSCDAYKSIRKLEDEYNKRKNMENNWLFLCFVTKKSDENIIMYAYRKVNEKHKPFEKKEFKFNWEKCLVDNEKDFVNFFVTGIEKYRKLINEHLYTLLLARYFYEMLGSSISLGLIQNIEHIEPAYIGIETNYQVKRPHVSCLKKIKDFEKCSYSENRQADMCLITRDKNMYLFEFKQKQENLEQRKEYLEVKRLFNNGKGKIDLEYFIDNNIVIKCGSINREYCKCRPEIKPNKDNFCSALDYIEVHNVGKAIESLFTSSSKINTISELGKLLGEGFQNLRPGPDSNMEFIISTY